MRLYSSDDLNYLSMYKIIAKSKLALVDGEGVDLSLYSKQPIPAFKSTKVTFLFVGRLLKEKGIIEYLQAARLVKKEFSHANFLVVGGVDENPSSIKKDVLDSYVDDGSIEYKGFLSDVRPALRDSDVLVLPPQFNNESRRLVLIN